MKAFASSRTQKPARPNAAIAGDFLDLAFELESGRTLPVLSRFEGPVTVALRGPATDATEADLDRLLVRLRDEAGIDIHRTAAAGGGAAPASITVEVIAKHDLQRLVPHAACFVTPNVSSWAEYRTARRTSQTDWTRLTTRKRMAVFLPGDHGLYAEVSGQVHEIFGRYTPLVEPLALDEAFLDVTGSAHLFGTPYEIAVAIRRQVREATGLAVSVGASTRKFLSKIASQVAKPDGLIVVQPGLEREFLHPLDVAYLWGVGPVTERKLHELGIRTVGDIAQFQPDALRTALGPGAAGHLYALANLQDPRPIERHRRAKSVGAQSAIRSRIRTMEELAPVLGRLVDRVAERLRAKDRTARTITVRVRFGDLSSVTRSATMPTPTASTEAIFDLGRVLLQKVVDEYPNHETSLVGISTSGLGVGEPVQLAMGVDELATLGGTPKELEFQELDRSVDELRRKYGRSAITHGSDLLSGRTSFSDGLSDVMTPDGSRIPDFVDDEAPVYEWDEDVSQE